MSHIFKWLADNYSWVFSGVGVAVLVGIAGWLLRRKAKSGEGTSVSDSRISDSMVAGRDISVHTVNISPGPTEPKTTESKEAILDAHFTRTHLMPRSVWHEQVETVMQLSGHKEYMTSAEFLCEVHVVNQTDNPVTVKRFFCKVTKGDEWKEVPIVDDLTLFQLKFDGPPQRWEDLTSLAKSLEGVPLTRGIGHKGWLRFEIEAENTFFKGQVFIALYIIDAFGTKHPVLAASPDEAARNRGRLVHNPLRVRDEQ